MTRKMKLKVPPSKLFEVVKHLQKLEKNNPDININNKPISLFLLEISEFETSQASIETEVKIAILETAGFIDPNPDTFKNQKPMAEFNFNDIQYIDLTEELNLIARKRNPLANMSIAQVKSCDTVRDCIVLVSQKSKP